MIDLHTHSCFSDGTDTPEALASLGDAMGLRALALTDHETLAGLPRFMAAQSSVKTLLVPGIELGCRFVGRELHVLGLFFDPDDPTLQTRVETLRVRRNVRNEALIARLQSLGIPLRLEDVQALAPSELLSRTHFARCLVNLGAAATPSEAYDRLIGEGGAAFVPFEDLHPAEAARWIHEAGGLAIVAHPGRFAGGNFIWDEAMTVLQDMGMDGLEAYYCDYGPSEQRYFLDLAAALRMIPSGGSDYHGDYKPGLQLGTGRGSLRIPDSVLETMLEHLERRIPA
ncbi:MAG: PHP domain-containing protein [Firmicutes bacterium]|nr:PHP domain-containing protein [Bacillota bacterium]